MRAHLYNRPLPSHTVCPVTRERCLAIARLFLLWTTVPGMVLRIARLKEGCSATTNTLWQNLLAEKLRQWMQL